MNRLLARKWLRKAAVLAGKAVAQHHPGKAQATAVQSHDWIHLAERAGHAKFLNTLSGPFPSQPMKDGLGLVLSTDEEWCFRWFALDVPSTYLRGGRQWMTGCGVRRMDAQANDPDAVFDVIAIYSAAENTLYHASRAEGDCRRNTSLLRPVHSGIAHAADMRTGLLVADGAVASPEVWAQFLDVFPQSKWAPLVAGPFEACVALAQGQIDALLVPEPLLQEELVQLGLSFAACAGIQCASGPGFSLFAHGSVLKAIRGTTVRKAQSFP